MTDPGATSAGGRRGGFTLLDGAAMIVGAAVASVHFSGVVPGRLTGLGWAFVWGAFAGVAVTAAGPALFVARRFVRRAAGYPRVGDATWAVLGLPWLFTALLRAPKGPTAPPGELYSTALTMGIAATSVVALAVAWRRWVSISKAEAESIAATPWTNRLGLVLAVAWPLQWGYGLLLLEDSGGIW
ncbi:MAG TPA: hypothetical protein VG406_15350 [Isosphaeraceae bacterium]|jgi:hypothetical protein|nr:hypothetical protein [Isosphaeraceae bacterium]